MRARGRLRSSKAPRQERRGPILAIRSVSRSEIGLALVGDGLEREESWRPVDPSSELLAHLAHLLAKAHLSLGDLRSIAVHRGPGSFSALRLGVATANALALASGLPVIGITGSCSPLDLARRALRQKSRASRVVPAYPPLLSSKKARETR